MNDEQLFIIRFDDMCPTMNWLVWDRLEEIMDRYAINPVLAVIPDCDDEKLRYSDPNPEFWIRVRQWKNKGYDLAMHGYSHVYTNKQSGILGITRQSEFSGLDDTIQRNKIENGVELLKKNGVESDIWIAPSHSFDMRTLKILKEYGFRYISDGFGTKIFKWRGFTWIPCQNWDRIIPQAKPGIYTICNHHSNWTEDDILQFEQDIIKNKSKIISLRSVLNKYPDIQDGVPFAHLKEVGKRKMKNIVKNILGR